MGFYLLHESMLDSILIARDKHLKEDGIILPSHAQILAGLIRCLYKYICRLLYYIIPAWIRFSIEIFFLAPCSLKTLKETTIDYWHDVYGYNMAPLAIESLKR